MVSIEMDALVGFFWVKQYLAEGFVERACSFLVLSFSVK
jgi:hypothetical protein